MPDAPDFSDLGAPVQQAAAPAQAPDFSDLGAPVSTHPVAGPSGSTLTDVGRRIGTAATDTLGGLLGLPRAAAEGVDWLGNKVGVNVGADKALSSVQQPGGGQLFPDPAAAREMAYQTTGATEYQPQTPLGRIGQSALTAAMGAPLGLANGVRGAAAAIPALAGGGATAGAAREILPDHPILDSTLGFLPGAAAGSLAANAARVVPGMGVRAATGWTPPGMAAAGGSLPIEDALLAQAATQNYGIPLSVSQVSTSLPAKIAASVTSKLPFNGGEAFADEQRGAWINGVAQQIDPTTNVTKLSSDFLASQRQRIGDQFNGIAARTSIPMDPPMMTRLQGVVDNARLNMSSDSVEPVERQAMNIIDTAANNNGNIGGQAYMDLTAKGGPLDTMMQSSDSGIRQAGIQLRNVLDTGMQTNAAPGDQAALLQARAQWKALKTVEPLTLRADTPGVATPSTGDISPASLRGAVNQSYQNAAVAPLGQIPLNDLAKIGQRFLKDPADSGTAGREAITHMISGGIGGIAGGEHGFGMGAVAALGAPLATMLAGRGVSAAMRNQTLANYAIRAGLNPDGFTFTGASTPQAAPSLLSNLANPPLAAATPATSQR